VRARGGMGLRTHHVPGAGRLRAELVATGLLPTPDRR